MPPRTTVQRRTKPAESGFALYATTEAGLEEVLASELRGIGAREIGPATRGVAFRGNLETVYRANLWLRTANRVLLRLDEFGAADRDALYAGARRIPWQDHLDLSNTLAVDAVCHRSALSHSQFVSRVVKDAIVDSFRSRTGRRPDVDARNPDLKLNARLNENRCTLSIDTSGERLHRRGYRPAFGLDAPLRETLAAGILLKSGFRGDGPLVDPMCGSGTFLVEGAMIARNIAPGLLGRSFAFSRHPSFDRSLWRRILAEAKAAVDGRKEIIIAGSDLSPEAIRSARAAVQGAGLDDTVRLRRADLADLPARGEGMLVTNPPYGERLGEIEQLSELYRSLGDLLKRRCTGMTAHVLTGSKFLAGRIGLKPSRRDTIWNGAIECRLLHYELY